MNTTIKGLIKKYYGLNVEEYDCNKEDVLLLSSGSYIHELDLLNDTIEIMKNKLNEFICDNSFNDARNILNDLDHMVSYYFENWTA